MSTLMGGQAEATEDMFSKLESMRAVITEVNTQFKDPVRTRACTFHPRTYLTPRPRARPRARSTTTTMTDTGKDNVRLRVHIRVPLPVRDGAARAGADGVRNRHAQHRREPAAVPEDR